MYHDPYENLAHPVTPLRDCAPHVRRQFGLAPPRRAGVTRDEPSVLFMRQRHLDSRLAPLEAKLGLPGNGGDAGDRLAEAQRRHTNMVAEMKAAKLEQTVARHEAGKLSNRKS